MFLLFAERKSKFSAIHSGGSPEPAPRTARVVNVASGITARAYWSRNEVSGNEPMLE